MDSFIYGLGLVVSAVNIFFWITIIISQMRQFKGNSSSSYIKKLLLTFAIISLISNLTPIWFDLYQIVQHAHPKNISIAYTISQYLYRTTTALMFYLIYRVR